MSRVLVGAGLGAALGAAGASALGKGLGLEGAAAGAVLGAIVGAATDRGPGIVLDGPPGVPGGAPPEKEPDVTPPFPLPGWTKYRTPLDQVALHESGWAPLDLPGVGPIEVTVLPLVPVGGPPGVEFARITYADYLALAEAWGLEPWTAAVGQLVYEQGYRLRPCTLWRPGADPYLQSLDFARDHDACVVKQLIGGTWDGREPVADAGKDWIVEPGRAPQPTDRGAVNWGWHEPSGKVIQTPGHRHEPSYFDYSQLSRFWRRR